MKAFVKSGLGLLGLALFSGPAGAADIMSEWAGVKAPPPPKLEDVTVDPKTTALLLLDFNLPICDPVARPRCKESLPALAKLLAAARAKNMMVVYSLGAGRPATDIVPELKPLGTEPVFSAGSDKFYGTELEKTLKDKGIQTLIVNGVAANGAALFTATAAVRRNFAVIAPVDGQSSDTAYAEQFAIWEMANSPGQVGKIKITKTDMIKFD